jgi:peroxiredoxin Q/BCP
MNDRTKPQLRQGSPRLVRAGIGLLLGVIAVVGFGAYWFMSQRSQSDNVARASVAPKNSQATATGNNAPQAGRFPYKVAKPGPGDMAPPIKLTTTRGVSFDLDTLRGQTVLLYFQEGLMCQACWEQLKAIEANFTQLRMLGIAAMVTITTDPPDLLAQKVRTEHYFMPVVADPSVAVSQAYHANDDGMMGKGTRYDAHTFIVVGPDSKILWRADYGGAPDYTMYIPVPDLIADIARGLKPDGQQTAAP